MHAEALLELMKTFIQDFEESGPSHFLALQCSNLTRRLGRAMAYPKNLTFN